MGITANFNMEDIEKQMNGFVAKIVNAAIQAMGFLGTKCVNHARTVPSDIGFKDQTGNLRSSIGFKVFVDGRPVSENYKQVLNGSEGIEKGKALADSVGAQCGQNQIMLVVTAGMEYAIHVESLGRDVITSSEQLARQEWPNMKARLDEMVRRQAQSGQW